MRKLLKWTGVVLGVLTILVLALIALNWDIAREMSRQLHMFSEPHFDIQTPNIPPLPSDRPAVLAFSKTNGFRHYEGIPAAQRMLEGIAAEHGWTLHASENNRAFERAWYPAELIRAQFVDHPISKHIQSATLRVRQPAHPIVRHLPARWERADEWYNFEASPSDRVTVLVDIDETSYNPEMSPMGEDHPLVWMHRVGKSRVFYSALGHTAETYEEAEYRQLISRAMQWALAGN